MKRIITILAIAGVVGIAGAVPAWAQAYGGGPGLSCTDEVVTGDHFTPNSTPTIYVDGDAVGKAQVGADGTFSFPLPSSVNTGKLTITVEGTSVHTTCSVVGVAGVAAVKTPPAATAFTGASIVTPTLIALALLVLGMASLLAGRRRRRTRAAAAGVQGNDQTS